MGGGRKGSSSSGKLQKSELGGVIFGCNNSTMDECLEKQLFGLPSPHFSYVKNIEPGLTLFLFNYSDRKLHGIYEAVSSGGMNIDPHAWVEDGKAVTAFPAQVRVCKRMTRPSIPESQFKKVLCGSHHKPQHYVFELNHAQAEGLIALFLASNPDSVSAAPNRHLLSEFDSEPIHVNELPLINSKGKNKKHGNSVTSLTPHQEMEFEEPSSHCENSMEEVQDVSHTFSEPQFSAEKMEVEVRGQVIENQHSPSSMALPNSCIYYHSPYEPYRMNEQTTTTSDLCNGNAELVQLVKELKETAATLEKKQIESELEILQLRNVVKDSGVEIQQLKNSVVELESKLMRTVGDGNSIYLIGGYTGISWLSSLDCFSPSMDILMSLKSMGSARSYASAVSLNDNIYVFGGRDGSSWFNTVECYRQRDENWSLCPPLNQAKASLAGATLNSKIFALGGGYGSECFSVVEMFDPTLGKWIYSQSMFQKRLAPAAAELHDVLYATGGFDGHEYLQTAERFDPRDSCWTKLPDMKSRRGCHSMAVLNEKLYVMGGFDGERTISSVEIFDPRNNLWTETYSLNHVRGNAVAVVLGGSVFVIGGVDDNNNGVETVECHREGEGWISCNYRTIGKRWSHSAVVL